MITHKSLNGRVLLPSIPQTKLNRQVLKLSIHKQNSTVRFIGLDSKKKIQPPDFKALDSKKKTQPRGLLLTMLQKRLNHEVWKVNGHLKTWRLSKKPEP